MLNLRVAGITFESTPHDRNRAYVIDPDGVTGLDDGPAVRRDSVARPGQHGAFAARGYRDARVISIPGNIVASSPLELQSMRDALMSVLADGTAGRLTADRPMGSRWADVMLADVPTVKVRGHTETEAVFQIQFWSPDPRLYGAVQEFPAGVPAVHYGNFPATPTLLVGAGSGGYTITGPSGRVVTVAAAPAAAHVIDFATGGLFLNGVRQVGAISVYQPWEVPAGLPGASASITGARSLVQRVTDTFI